MSDPTPPPIEESEQQGSTSSAGQSVDEGKGRIFPCEGCGADLKFHIGQQQLKCPYCGFEKELEFAEDAEIVEQDFHEILERLQKQRDKEDDEQTEESDQNEVRCNACGGSIVFVGSLTSSECPYCASPIQRDDVHQAEHRIPVDGVLPFLIDQKVARTNLTEWVNSRWFAPNEFRQRGVNGKFNGIYLPYWTFDSMTFTRYSGKRGEYYYVTTGSGKDKKTVRHTRWYPASGSFLRFFDDVLVLASRGLNPKLMLKLEPWPLAKCIPFNQEVLAGYLARTYEVELDEGFIEGKSRIESALSEEVSERIGGDTQQIHSIKTQYSALKFKHLLLPVWLMAYRYHDKTFQVMINAGTGEVQGDRPYSWIKITLAVISGLTVVGGLVFFFSNS